jgi:arabinofuranosyltransferase
MADRRRITIAIASSLALLLGWSTFCFMTDDAFIAFRYISNSVAGHGWVWNAAPFRPVDGYTSLAWIVLLEGIWRTTGIDPPRAANFVALAFAFGQLALILRMLWSLWLPSALERVRAALVVLALAGILGNRTFLAWTSSGLETAMFDFEILLWFWLAAFRRPSIELVAVAVLAALTRPDGLLYVAATFVIVGFAAPGMTKPARRRAIVALVMGALAIAAYLGWHLHRYGEWFPNTFYAKVSRYWWRAGLRYFASFVLEYALWWWLVAIVLLAIRWRPALHHVKQALPALTVLAHAAYYTLVVGGDHFEYRVYAPLVPLAFIGMVWALARMRWPTRRTLVMLGAFVVSSMILPWTHWLTTHELATRRESGNLQHRIAPHLLAPLSWYAEPFDELQVWLIERMICVRHQEHKIFYEHKVAQLPPREDGERIGPDDVPAHAAGEAGYVAWVLPNVAIIDSFGLNDYYIARNSENTVEKMAHSRSPPPGYVEAFAPNVHVVDGSWTVAPRKHAPDVAAIERRYDVWLANLR